MEAEANEGQIFGQRCGVVVRGAPNQSLAGLDGGAIERLFCQHGMLVFRGFSVGPAAFDALARRFTATHMRGYGRAPFADFDLITMGNESGLPLEPHCDNGMRPEAQRPEITWFFCEVPADQAGETTFFDGVRVWERLSASTQALLLARRISFVTRYAPSAWRQMGFPDADAFARFVPSLGGAQLQIQLDGAVDVEVLSPAVRRGRFDGRNAFVSSLCVAGSAGFRAMTVRFEGAAEIPADVRREVRAALADCCAELRWQAGDVVMLDNTRFLHGRRAYSDQRRRLYLIQTLRASFP